ncbi:MAG TPA: ABC transporter permease [Gemmatimonadaceae bacterium]
MATLLAELRHALRSLARSPGFVLAAVACLAIGIGANATMFGIVDSLLFRAPPHVADAEEVRRLYLRRTFPGIGEQLNSSHSWPDYEILLRDTRSFARVAAATDGEVTIGRGEAGRRVPGNYVTPSFFPLLGVRPALGRFFTEEENAPPGGTPVAVISHGLWQAQFGGEQSVIGREIVVDDRPYTIVGVAPEGFTGADLSPVEVWVPIRTSGGFMGEPEVYTSRRYIWLTIFARLTPGVAPSQAEAAVTTAYREETRDEPRGDPNARLLLAPIQVARGPEGTETASVSMWLAGVAAIVLLVACANVANLLLARSLRRRRELAVRVALGAGRGRLVAGILTESLILALLGAGAGLLLAFWGGSVVRAMLLRNLASIGTPFDPRVLAFAAAATLVTALICGIVPALQMSRPDLTSDLKAGAREGTFHRGRLRATLLVTQVALSVMLLFGAGLFVQSLRNVRAIDLGFDADRLLMGSVELPREGYPPERRSALYKDMMARVAVLPGIEAAAVAVTSPFYSTVAFTLTVPGRDSLPPRRHGGPYMNAVTPDFFRTMGIALRRGRLFTEADGATSERVAVINEEMARYVWPNEEAIGRCFHSGADTTPCIQVVGIVENQVNNDLRAEEPAAFYYLPFDQAVVRFPMRSLFVRTAAEPAAMVNTVRRAMQGVSPELPSVEVRSLEEMMDGQIRPWRLGATLFGVFGLVALAIAALGLYGVLAYTVAQRTHEMGVRVALGAQRGDVLRLVVGQGTRLALIGVAIGAVGALAGGRALASHLYGVSASDPATLAGVAVTLVAVAALASWLPARRATRVDPVVALRVE